MSSTALVLSTPDMEIKYSQNILLKSTADKILSRCITKWEILMNDHVFLHHNKHRWHRNTYGIRGKEYSKAAQSGIASSTVFDGPQLSIPKAKRDKDRERERALPLLQLPVVSIYTTSATVSRDICCREEHKP